MACHVADCTVVDDLNLPLGQERLNTNPLNETSWLQKK